MARTTSTGISINELALKMKQKDPTLNFKDAKKKAKEYEQAKNVLEYGKGGKLKHKLLQKVLGKHLGSYVADKIRSSVDDDKAAEIIGSAEHPQVGSESASPIRSTEIKAILQKLDKIDAKLSAVKAVKVAPPTEKDADPVKPEHYEDATLGLKALGYKKEEITEMLKGAKGTSAQDLIKSALKPKNKEAIPIAAVPGAVDTAKQNVMKAPEPSAAVPEAPKPKTEKKKKEPEKPKNIFQHFYPKIKSKALTKVFGQSLGSYINDRTTKPKIAPEQKDEPVKSDKTQQKILDKVTVLENLALSEKSQKGLNIASTPEPTPVAQKSTLEVMPDEQKEARDTSNLETDRAQKKKESEERKKILDELDEIKNKVGNGLMGLFDKFILPILPFLSTILAPVLAAAAVGALIYKGTQWLLKKMGYTGETLGKFFSPQDEQVEALNAKHAPDEGKVMVQNKIQGTGFTALGAGKYKDQKGNVLNKAQLPPDVKAKLDTNKIGADQLRPNDKGSVSGKIQRVNQENAELKSADKDSPPIVINNNTTQASPPAPAPQNQPNTMVVNVRNTEPSQGSYIGSIFNHVVARAVM